MSTPLSIVDIPATWQNFLSPMLQSSQFSDLMHEVNKEYKTHQCFPPKAKIFRALSLTAPEQVKVIILGQDPYHGNGQAHGLSFSANNDCPQPPSLRNIFKELENDTGIIRTKNNLEDWAKQGILLLNATLTVRAHTANSHAHLPWQRFTDFIIQKLSREQEYLVFVLWGNFAQKKEKVIDSKKHLILKSAHPSPLSAHRGFFGSGVFGKINQYLSRKNQSIIHW